MYFLRIAEEAVDVPLPPQWEQLCNEFEQVPSWRLAIDLSFIQGSWLIFLFVWSCDAEVK